MNTWLKIIKRYNSRKQKSKKELRQTVLEWESREPLAVRVFRDEGLSGKLWFKAKTCIWLVWL